MINHRQAGWFLLGLVAVVLLYQCVAMAQPFWKPLAAAAVLAVVFDPLHRWLQRTVRRPGLAAALSTTAVIIGVLMPLTIFSFALASQMRELAATLRAMATDPATGNSASDWLNRVLQWARQYLPMETAEVRQQAATVLQHVGERLVAGVGKVLGGLTGVVLNTVLAFVALFFFFRDAGKIRDAVQKIPLPREQACELLHDMKETIRSSLYSGLSVAVVQGILTGLGLWGAGVPAPVVWGFVTVIAAFIPTFGSGLVWLPAAGYLALTGQWWRAALLVAWGALVVGLADNALRPYLIRHTGKVKLNFLILLFAVLGGIEVYGILGVIIGPVVVAATRSVLRQLLRAYNRREESDANWRKAA